MLCVYFPLGVFWDCYVGCRKDVQPENLWLSPDIIFWWLNSTRSNTLETKLNKQNLKKKQYVTCILHSAVEWYWSVRGRFCARSLASCIPRSSEDRSSWMFFIQLVHSRPGGHIQFSGGGLKMAWRSHPFVQDVQRQMAGLNDGWKWWLVGNATDVSISDKVVPVNVQDCS